MPTTRQRTFFQKDVGIRPSFSFFGMRHSTLFIRVVGKWPRLVEVVLPRRTFLPFQEGLILSNVNPVYLAVKRAMLCQKGSLSPLEFLTFPPRFDLYGLFSLVMTELSLFFPPRGCCLFFPIQLVITPFRQETLFRCERPFLLLNGPRFFPRLSHFIDNFDGTPLSRPPPFSLPEVFSFQ